MIELNEHQKIPVEFMKNHRGLILYHGMGAGKSLTALFSVYNFSNEIVIIGEKSSKKVFRDNIAKAEMDLSRFTFYTYAKIKKLLEDDIKIFKDKSVIIDEAHKLRNENLHNLYISSALILAFKVLLLTGTPVLNYLNDLAVLVNIVKASDDLPTDKKLFDQMFYDEERMVIINQKVLENKLKNTISYYRINDTENFPTSTNYYMEVEMSHKQVDEYKYYIKKIIYEDNDIVNNIDILNLNYALLPNKKRNFFLNVTRQISNTVKNSTNSPKIQEIFDKIKKGPFPIVVYSNFLKNGVYTLAVILEENGLKYKSITGFTSGDKLNLIVNNYNNRLFDILLISSAGSESLDLKNTRQIHIMEPHWNDSKIQQVIGRAIRYQSHIALPEEERHVDIYYWISIFNSRIKNMSADQYLMHLSQKKKDLWDKYQEIIIDASIEKQLYVN